MKGEEIFKGWEKLEVEEDNAPEIELAELVQALIEVAKQEGYDDYREYLISVMRDSDFDYEEHLTSMIDDYLRAIALKKKKDWGEGYWDENSTFEEYLHERKIGLLNNLERLEEERKQRMPSFIEYDYYRDKFGESNVQFSMPKAGESPEAVIYEFYEYIMKKSLETIDKALRGEIKPKPRLGIEEETGGRLISND